MSSQINQNRRPKTNKGITQEKQIGEKLGSTQEHILQSWEAEVMAEEGVTWNCQDWGSEESPGGPSFSQAERVGGWGLPLTYLLTSVYKSYHPQVNAPNKSIKLSCTCVIRPDVQWLNMKAPLYSVSSKSYHSNPISNPISHVFPMGTLLSLSSYFPSPSHSRALLGIGSSPLSSVISKQSFPRLPLISMCPSADYKVTESEPPSLWSSCFPLRDKLVIRAHFCYLFCSPSLSTAALCDSTIFSAPTGSASPGSSRVLQISRPHSDTELDCALGPSRSCLNSPQGIWVMLKLKTDRFILPLLFHFHLFKYC